MLSDQKPSRISIWDSPDDIKACLHHLTNQDEAFKVMFVEHQIKSDLTIFGNVVDNTRIDNFRRFFLTQHTEG